MVDLITLSLIELEKVLSNTDSYELIEYLTNLDKNSKDTLLDRIEKILGKNDVYLLNEAINDKLKTRSEWQRNVAET